MRRALLALVLLLAACSDDEPDATSPEPTTTSPEPSSTSTSSSSTTAPAVTFDDVVVRATEVATVEGPTAMTTRSGADDVLFVVEREGRVRVLRDDQLQPEPLVDISDDVRSGGERGLLGIAFSPDGDRLYLSYTDTNGDTRIDELLMSGDAVDLGSRRQVLAVDQPYGNHNGGDITFGPDGFLYVGLGDGGSGGDPHGHGQNPDTLLGSLLRIDPINRGNDLYAIPAGNPFVGGGGRAEIWHYGLRNPWRFSFDRETGDLWIGDVGQGGLEEIDFLPAGSPVGANFGWNRLEGTESFRGDPPAEHVLPIFEYPTADGCAVTGGYVYRGSAIAGLQGAYLYGDYCNGDVRALVQRDGRVVAERSLGFEVASLSSFGQRADGELYALSLAGPIFRLDP